MELGKNPAQPSGPEPVPLPGVEVDDELYLHHGGHPRSGRVICHGKHGVTCDVDGKPAKVPWDKVLGHKKRVAIHGEVVEQGEDGMIVQDAQGRRRFIGVPNEAKEDPYLAKAEDGREIILMLKGQPIANRPGLVQKESQDKRGVTAKRWVRANPDQPKGRPRAKAAPPGGQGGFAVGDEVKFTAGDFNGTGSIVGKPGAAGAHVKDSTGRVHKVRWAEMKRPPPEKPDYEPRETGESDKQYAKRVVDKGPAPKHLPEEHDKYFNTEGSTHVPLHKLHSTKSDDENAQGGDNGPKRMLAAYHGHLGKRDPVTVMPHAEHADQFEVVDGNGTLTSAKKLGWQGLPTKIVSREEGEKMQATDKAGDKVKAVLDPAKYGELPPKAKQPASTQEELYAKAAEGLEQLRDWLNRGKGVASQMGFQSMKKAPSDVTPEEWAKPGGMLFIAGLKAADGRAKEKVDADYGGDWSKLLDVVRCTLAVDNLDDMADTIRQLEGKGLTPMQQPKNRFAKPTEMGYRDMVMIVQLPNGMAAEVQFNVKDMLQAKNAGHKLYEKSRSIVAKNMKDGVIADPSTWDPADRAAYDESEAAQKKLYDDAWMGHVKKHYGRKKST